MVYNISVRVYFFCIENVSIKRSFKLETSIKGMVIFVSMDSYLNWFCYWTVPNAEAGQGRS